LYQSDLSVPRAKIKTLLGGLFAAAWILPGKQLSRAIIPATIIRGRKILLAKLIENPFW
jgi:hypothetical protein